MARTIAIVALPGVIALDYSIAANILGGQPGYRVIIAGEASASGGVRIVPTHDIAGVDEADTVVLPGFDDPHIPPPDEYLDVIARGFDRGATMVGICTGTFALAAAGITAGRQVTAHWQFTAQLQDLYPSTKVIENVLFVEDGNLLTAAGGGAGIDLCLHLIRSDFGVDAELTAGKSFVAAPARPGPQPQYVDTLTPPGSDLAETRYWAMENLSSLITVDSLARRSAMARRTFIRRFGEETGMPPMRWLTLQRILLARRLLETTDWSVDRIAAQSGMGTGANFRVLFRRETGLAPSEYRRLHKH
ncbi:helix-turn-helix domain-containing protein [Kibdelosporangium philippinense]|uniref:Helix-turn-helix domain-containing protein n=1 Tax=Kibdelosporangium philippinense TaxID=211113 RepID=A0ABS8ZTL0_9PSEU|nr:helix-turn-helix domain-containing protein [Kibdelosporangium philippinense]MCE7011041.1 helix-turn-helix domain-containing protein [Kibdelosporangium philippinense]